MARVVFLSSIDEYGAPPGLVAGWSLLDPMIGKKPSPLLRDEERKTDESHGNGCLLVNDVDGHHIW